jgi:hypothetical protein
MTEATNNQRAAGMPRVAVVVDPASAMRSCGDHGPAFAITTYQWDGGNHGLEWLTAKRSTRRLGRLST